MSLTRLTAALCLVLGLAACGGVYVPADVRPGSRDGTAVRVVPINPETVMDANLSPFQPRTLPAILRQTTGVPARPVSGGVAPPATVLREDRPGALELRIPPTPPQVPYTVGIGDVVLLATPQASSTIEQLSGLLAAQTRRQGYTVQDDGAIAIPDVGRIPLAGLTLEEAEGRVFQSLVARQIDPAFSLEVAEFNSKRVTIGGAVRNPTTAPITLKPLFLDEALAAAGGITVRDQDFATVRLYREGTLYQIPLRELFSRRSLQRIPLQDGDSLFVDTEFELEKAQAYFEEQIRLAEFRQRSRASALDELNTEFNIRRNAAAEARENFKTRLELGAVARDYAYITGEVEQQSRYPLPFEQRASLADALLEGGGGWDQTTGNPSQIYVLRADGTPGGVTAWQLDGRNAANLSLATRFELRPDDVIFVASQPITRWNRVIQQAVPSLINTSARLATAN